MVDVGAVCTEDELSHAVEICGMMATLESFESVREVSKVETPKIFSKKIKVIFTIPCLGNMYGLFVHSTVSYTLVQILNLKVYVFIIS